METEIKVITICHLTDDANTILDKKTDKSWPKLTSNGVKICQNWT